MSENIDINVALINEEITISAINNLNEVVVNAVSSTEEVNVTANTNLIQVNINTAPLSIINPQDYDLSQFTNTSPNPFVQQNTLSTYVPIFRTIKINGVLQDLSADREWNFPVAIWGSISGTLSAQTDLVAALAAKQDTLTLTTTGSSGAATLVGATLNIPNYTISGLGGVPSSRTLTINGTTYDLSADRTWTIATGLTVGTTPISSGAVGRVLFEGAGNVLQEDQGLTYDSTNKRLQFGTTSTRGYITYDTSDNTLFNIDLESGRFFRVGTEFRNIQVSFASNIFRSALNIFQAANGTELARFFSNGNFAINTAIDAGFKLDVNGNFRALNIEAPAGYLYNIGTNTNPYATIYSVNYNSPANVSLLATQTTYIGAGNTYGLAIFQSTRNILIQNGGTFTDAGYRLDVNGSMRVGSPNQSLIFTPTATSPLLDQNGSVGSRIRTTSGVKFLQLESYAGDANYLSATGAELWIRTTDSNNIYFRTNNTTAGIISTNQNWSIGSTIDAGYKLDVNGTFRSNSIWTNSSAVTYWGIGSSTTAYGILTWGTGYATVGATLGNVLYLTANGGSATLTLNTLGNVGIGTVSPNGRLDVQQNVDGNGLVIFANQSTGTSARTAIAIGNNTGNIASIDLFGGNYTVGSTDDAANGLRILNSGIGGIAFRASNASGTIRSYIGSTEVMRVDSNGNVAIGTTSAFTTGGTAKLSIAGTVFSFGASNTDLSYFRSLGSGVVQWQTYNSANVGQMHLQPYGGNILIGNTVDAGYRLDVTGTFRVSGNSIFSSGSVGIGTATPSGKLHVSTPDATILAENPSGGKWAQLMGGSGVSGIGFDNSGTFSIFSQPNASKGTFGSTTAVLTISGGNISIGGSVFPSVAWTNALSIGPNGTNKIITGYLSSSTNGAVIGAHSSALNAWADLNIIGDAIIFRRLGEVEAMRIANTSNVLIGTTTDAGYKLDVNGTFKVSGAIYDSTNSPGTSGQVLSSTVTGTAWITAGGGGGGTIYKLTAQTLTAASWTLVSGYYQYTFSNVNITVNTRVDFTPANASYTEVTTCGMLPQVDVAAGSCTFYSLFPPQSDILGEITIFPTI